MAGLLAAYAYLRGMKVRCPLCESFLEFPDTPRPAPDFMEKLGDHFADDCPAIELAKVPGQRRSAA